MTRASALSFRLLSCCRRGLLAVALALGGLPAAHAANAADWWVYVANDYPDDIRELLAQGADPNVRYKNGQPAIMRAVADGAWKVFDVLAADKRTDLNIENPAGETPLMYLAIAGQTERARQLIARGAQVNRLGWTPLHYAASKGQLGVAKLLLEKRALVNAPSPDGATPLMMAALSGSRPMVQLLLDAGADITTRDLKGQSAADWARMGKSTALADELARRIASADAAKRARRAGGAAEPAAEAPAAAPAAAPVAESVPAPAAAAAAPESGPDRSRVRGVSGVRLNSYDEPASP